MHDEDKNSQLEEESAAENESAVDQALQSEPDEQPPVEEPVQKTNDELVVEAQQEVLRVRAEMENFRKRQQRESDAALKYANMNLVRDLLEAVDNLKRATDAAQDDNASAAALRDGVVMVGQQIEGVLEKYGCKAIDALGCEFDPNVHEAIGQMPSEEHAAGIVAQEVAVGYRLHDRVVRPSSVLVSTGAPAAAE
ncbi:MAG: nucleotide exchange factor GrpE [Aureliella sp.]